MRRTLLTRALALIACAPALARTPEGPVPPTRPQNPLAPDAWVGVWVGAANDDELVLTLERRGDAYAGTIELGGQRYPLVARRGERLEGTFTSQGHEFPFTATREGATTLVLSSGGVDRRLTRRAAPAGPAAPAPGADRGGGGAAPADWQTYKHALGHQLRYPPGWQLTETEAGLAFTPPDLARDPQGQPLELILINAAPAQGVTRPDDRRAVQLVESQLQALFPFLSRSGAPSVREVGGHPAAELLLAGTNPSGRRFEAVVVITLLNDHAVVGLVVAEPERARARAAQLRTMVGSAGRGEAQRDGRLVGTWRHEHHTFSGTFSSTSIRTITLRQDGVCLDSARTLASMTHSDAGGNETGSSSVDSGQDAPGQGTWAADGRRLIMQWSGGVEEWEYELGGDAMLLKSGSGKPKLYQRVN